MYVYVSICVVRQQHYKNRRGTEAKISHLVRESYMQHGWRMQKKAKEKKKPEEEAEKEEKKEKEKQKRREINNQRLRCEINQSTQCPR